MQKKPLFYNGEELIKKNNEINFKKPDYLKDKDGYYIPINKTDCLNYHPEIVLYCPQIPQNTGSIARLCAAFSCRLHIVEPIPFTITEKALKRAGLDYWDYVEVYMHKSWELFKQAHLNRRYIFIETKGTSTPGDFKFLPGDLLIFGAETFGIPKNILNECENDSQNKIQLTLPMYHDKVRSINLANTVSIVCYLACHSLTK